MQGKRYKKLFWVSATGPLVTVILMTLFNIVTKLDEPKGKTKVASVCTLPCSEFLEEVVRKNLG